MWRLKMCNKTPLKIALDIKSLPMWFWSVCIRRSTSSWGCRRGNAPSSDFVVASYGGRPITKASYWLALLYSLHSHGSCTGIVANLGSSSPSCDSKFDSHCMSDALICNEFLVRGCIILRLCNSCLACPKHWDIINLVVTCVFLHPTLDVTMVAFSRALDPPQGWRWLQWVGYGFLACLKHYYRFW